MLGKIKIEVILLLIGCLIGCAHKTESRDNCDNCYEVIRKTKKSSKMYMDFRENYQKENPTIGNRDSLIVLTGSSTIAGWHSLQTDLAGYHVVNRHFNGCNADDLIYNLDVIAGDLQPSCVIVYTGDNDAVTSANEDIYERIRCFVSTLYMMVPNVKLVFISIKPSPMRLALFPRYIQLNAFLKSLADADPSMGFIDLWTPMFREDGTLNEACFVDTIHLSPEGYKILTAKVRDYLNLLSNL